MVLATLGLACAGLLAVLLAVVLTPDGTDATEDLRPSRSRPSAASQRGGASAAGRKGESPPELPASDAAIPSRGSPRVQDARDAGAGAVPKVTPRRAGPGG